VKWCARPAGAYQTRRVQCSGALEEKGFIKCLEQKAGGDYMAVRTATGGERESERRKDEGVRREDKAKSAVEVEREVKWMSGPHGKEGKEATRRGRRMTLPLCHQGALQQPPPGRPRTAVGPIATGLKTTATARRGTQKKEESERKRARARTR